MYSAKIYNILSFCFIHFMQKREKKIICIRKLKNIIETISNNLFLIFMIFENYTINI